MDDLEVRIVELEPMRVATALGFGESPEPIAWGKILAFGESRGLLKDLDKVRFFGFNNPDPSPGSPNYGYEQWMTVGEEVEAEGDVKIKDFEGGVYAVTRFKDLNRIGNVWKALVVWQEDSKYRRGNHQWLEEQISPPDTASFEDLIFDLYLPIME
jgi:effector-binding domain-containing protein